MRIKKIDEVRAQIRELQGQRNGLQAQSRSRAEVRTHVESLVNEWHNEARAQHALNLRLLATGQARGLLSADKFGPAVVLLLGTDHVTNALLTHLDGVPEGFDAAARKARITEINAELDTLEAEEEALIVVAEEAGERVIRRADARPEIVLGRREPPPAVRPRSPHYQGKGDVVPKRRRFAIAPTFEPGVE